MPTNRSYGDACGIARALDVVGERWAVLVVRELLFGPLRFADLRRALARASSNMVADRLRELEGHGVVRRRPLPAPAGGQVYELTEAGRALEPAVLALGEWGLRFPRPPEPVTLSATSVLLFLRGTANPDFPGTCRVELADRVFTVRGGSGGVHVEAGEPAGDADVVLRTDPWTLDDLLADPASLDAAVAGGTVTVSGDLPALRLLLATGS
jgi:DNA-binding HxlR family transcriptional regulator